MGGDARRVINAQQQARAAREGYRIPNDGDRIPALSREIGLHIYPEGFKPVGFNKYDGKTPPQQWLRVYSQAIEVANGSDITKVAYFPLALESAQLLWLESLPPNSIHSWEDMRQVFIDNFQRVVTYAGTHHDLSQCK